MPAAFDTPAWGARGCDNTCVVDSYLATLLCADHRNQEFSRLLCGQDEFTHACKSFLEDSKTSMQKRKLNFINKLFKPEIDGDFNLFGDETDIILERAKEASTITLTTQCTVCDKKATSSKDYHYAGLGRSENLPEIVLGTIHREGREHRCVDAEKCKGAVKNTQIEAPESTWVVPVDLTQLALEPKAALDLPLTLKLGNKQFCLTGVSLYSRDPAHYTCILYDNNDWNYYDGMSKKRLVPFTENAIKKAACIKIAYYLLSKQ